MLPSGCSWWFCRSQQLRSSSLARGLRDSPTLWILALCYMFFYPRCGQVRGSLLFLLGFKRLVSVLAQSHAWILPASGPSYWQWGQCEVVTLSFPVHRWSQCVAHCPAFSRGTNVLKPQGNVIYGIVLGGSHTSARRAKLLVIWHCAWRPMEWAALASIE